LVRPSFRGQVLPVTPFVLIPWTGTNTIRTTWGADELGKGFARNGGKV